MPVWYETLKPFVDDGKLVIVGVVQEQHPDRARLFAQWKGITGPLLSDPVNYLHAKAVPVFVAVDENGYVRDTKPDLKTFVDDFVKKEFPGEPAFITPNTDEPPNTRVTRRMSEEARNAAALVSHGEALVLAGELAQVEEAIEVYGKAIEDDAKNAMAYFGLGVAYRMRYDSEKRLAPDFQASIDAWAKALSLAPNNYIYRRRLQQYGPALDRPYAFYDWVATARKEIKARGEEPLPLVSEPIGTELGGKAAASAGGKHPQGDPKGKVTRDKKHLIALETAVVRSTESSQKGESEVHLTLRPSIALGAHWNNESEPLRVWLKAPKGVKVAPVFLEWPNAEAATSDEIRTLSFAVTRDEKSRKAVTIRGYALYNACEGAEGKCVFRRQDFQIKIK